MALAFVAERAKGTNAAGTTQNISVSPTQGNSLVLWLVFGPPGTGTANVSSITDNATPANTWTVDSTKASSASGATTGGAWCSCANVANVPTQITVTMSASVTVVYKVEEFSGGPITFDAGNVAQGTATAAETTGSVTPAGAGELAVAGFATSGTAESSFTVGGSYLQAGTTRNAAPDIAFEYLLSGSSGAQTASGTWATAPALAAQTVNGLAFYKPPAGATQHLLACMGFGH